MSQSSEPKCIKGQRSKKSTKSLHIFSHLPPRLLSLCLSHLSRQKLPVQHTNLPDSLPLKRLQNIKQNRKKDNKISWIVEKKKSFHVHPFLSSLHSIKKKKRNPSVDSNHSFFPFSIFWLFVVIALLGFSPSRKQGQKRISFFSASASS